MSCDLRKSWIHNNVYRNSPEFLEFTRQLNGAC